MVKIAKKEAGRKATMQREVTLYGGTQISDRRCPDSKENEATSMSFLNDMRLHA